MSIFIQVGLPDMVAVEPGVDFGLPVDIHGLHVDSFTRHHAKRFAELKWCAQGENGTPYLRFSFDRLKYADGIHKALAEKKNSIGIGAFGSVPFHPYEIRI